MSYAVQCILKLKEQFCLRSLMKSPELPRLLLMGRSSFAVAQ
jgi:hypothetical protein